MASSTQTSRSNQGAIVAEAINTLNSRIEKSESDFIMHLRKVEDRLDQIVDLTKTVAVLQQNSTTQTDNITEMRTHLKENSQRIDASIGRLHNRLDEIIAGQRDKLELHTKESEIKLKNIEDKFQNNVDSLKHKSETECSGFRAEIKSDLKAVTVKADVVESELKKWLNRGWGVWGLAVVIFGSVQTFAFKWVGSLEDERNRTATSISSINSINEKQTTLIESTRSKVEGVESNIKRLEQMVLDNERQLEYARRGNTK